MKKIAVVSVLLLFLVVSVAYPVCLLDFTTESVPDGTVNVPYSFQIEACCGTTPYTFSIYSGTLPAGLSLSSSGVISGTPTAVDDQTVFFRVVDSASPQCSKVQAMPVRVN